MSTREPRQWKILGTHVAEKGSAAYDLFMYGADVSHAIELSAYRELEEKLAEALKERYFYKNKKEELK